MKPIIEKKVFDSKSICFISDNYVTIEAPIGILDIVQGLRAVTENGKHAKSKFRLLHYDEINDTSLIECKPITG